ncbi:hypothetical protein ACLB2K_076481 [Fragaria x ananassa]
MGQYWYNVIHGPRLSLFNKKKKNKFQKPKDKKNEHKEVAVDEFLPCSTAAEAIQYSMQGEKDDKIIAVCADDPEDLYAEYILHTLRR